MSNVDFEKVLKDGGIPTTEEELTQEWESELNIQGNPLTNSSRWSPFRRLIDAIMVKPAKHIIESIINISLPNQFVLTASSEALEQKAADLNITRNLATKTTGLITFTREDTVNELSIESGTIVQTPLIQGDRYRLILTEDAIFNVGSSVTTAAVIAEFSGAVFNLPTQYYNTLENPIDGVSVSNEEDWIVSPGLNEESDDDLRLRCRNQFNLVGEFHTDDVYRGLLSSEFGLKTDNIYFVHNAPRGPGTANCYVLLDVGNASSEYLDSINDFIGEQGNHGHGDDLIVYSVPETLHDVVVNIYPIAGLTSSQKTTLTNSLYTFIRAAFRENLLYQVTTTRPDDVFSFSRLSQEIHQQFPYVERLVFFNSDIVSTLSIPRLNNLSVIMNE